MVRLKVAELLSISEEMGNVEPLCAAYLRMHRWERDEISQEPSGSRLHDLSQDYDACALSPTAARTSFSAEYELFLWSTTQYNERKQHPFTRHTCSFASLLSTHFPSTGLFSCSFLPGLASRLELGSQVGLTTDHSNNCCLSNTLKI